MCCYFTNLYIIYCLYIYLYILYYIIYIYIYITYIYIFIYIYLYIYNILYTYIYIYIYIYIYTIVIYIYIWNEIRNTKFNIRETNRENKSKIGIPFVVTHQPSTFKFSLRYHKKKSQSSQYRSKGQPMVSFRSACKLSSYLVRAKLYPLERKMSS